MPSSEIKLQEIICWSVWEKYSEDPINGWMRELGTGLQLNKEETSDLNETIASTAISID